MRVLRSLSVLLIGMLFGLGLMISGMIQPKKVQDFLDVTGRWDSSLLFVMGGALLVTSLTFPRILKRRQPVLDHEFHLPAARQIDAQLIIGAALFGIGWGLGGFCPGPALVGLAMGSRQAMIFVGAMLLGMALHRSYRALRQPRPRHS